MPEGIKHIKPKLYLLYITLNSKVLRIIILVLFNLKVSCYYTMITSDLSAEAAT